MKKILMILICGFAFTQSIQTKQVEVPFNQHTESIDISEYIDLGEGYYNVEIIYIENFNFEILNGNVFGGSTFEYRSPLEYGGHLRTEIYENNIEDENGNQVLVYTVYNAYHSAIVTQNNSVFTKYLNAWDDTEWFYSGTLIMNITGLFEDELMPDVGDMNLDGNINVVDVVLLVDSILGIG